MVVDDSEPMRVLVRRLLEFQEDGFSLVAEAGTRVEALSAYEDARPDLVLLDVDLAGDDGLDVARGLQTLDPSARIVLLTGAPTPEVEAAAQSSGIVAVLSKTDLPQLVAQLRDFF
jgi:DNA-binding NarL/FixJ family response regulator